MASEGIAIAGLVAPPTLQGFSPSLSLAVARAFDEARPPIHAIPSYRTLSVLNEKGLARDYADLITGYQAGGILDRQRLHLIGSTLGLRYFMLPGLAEFNQTVLDKFEVAGIKALRTRITTLRLWLQLWDTRTAQIVWESGGEVTAVTQLLRAKRTVPLDLIAQKLWLQMLQEGLLGGNAENRLLETEESLISPATYSRGKTRFVHVPADILFAGLYQSWQPDGDGTDTTFRSVDVLGRFCRENPVTLIPASRYGCPECAKIISLKRLDAKFCSEAVSQRLTEGCASHRVSSVQCEPVSRFSSGVQLCGLDIPGKGRLGSESVR